MPALTPPSCTLAFSLDSDVISLGSNYPRTSQQPNNSFIRLLRFTPMPNQNKPLLPLEEIMPHILRFWKARLTDKAIVEELRKVIDTDRYGIGIMKLKEIQSDMGLQRARQQGHSVETIHDAMLDLRQIYPNSGSREMISLLFHERGMAVSR
ncbi:hypothetical protein EDB19DRAFT_1835618 [Suillus lakei]|nr:hypothetical protein EDB19DRAFT_1835618 [Suillus lakei]